MLLADDLIVKKNCSKEMIALHKRTSASVIAAKKVDRKSVSRWGILGFKSKNKNSFLINDVVEKPKLSEAPSNYAIIGRYILPKKILNILDGQKRGKGGEIHITDAIRTLLKKRKFLWKYIQRKIYRLRNIRRIYKLGQCYIKIFIIYETLHDRRWLCWSRKWNLFCRLRK